MYLLEDWQLPLTPAAFEQLQDIYYYLQPAVSREFYGIKSSRDICYSKQNKTDSLSSYGVFFSTFALQYLVGENWIIYLGPHGDMG